MRLFFSSAELADLRHNVFDLGESDVELQVGFVNKISSWVTFVAPHHSILYAYCLALLLVSIKLLEIIMLKVR